MIHPVLDRIAAGVHWRWWRLYQRTAYELTPPQRLAWETWIRLETMREPAAGTDYYVRRVNALHRKLGIPRSYRERGLALHREATELVSTPGLDGRDYLMTSETRSRWLAMQAAAAAAGITLAVRCAFRSVSDQALLIGYELACGGNIEQVLTATAAPGYSQHHTGRALDLDCVPVAAEFGETPAYAWLEANAAAFGFELSYPRGNPHGIMYEPWHWLCKVG